MNGMYLFLFIAVERPARDRCSFPKSVLHHEHGLDWESVDGGDGNGDVLSVHLNHKGHSLKLRQREGLRVVDKQASCHRVESQESADSVRIVAHVKAGW